MVIEAWDVAIGNVPEDAVKEAIDTAPENLAVPALNEAAEARTVKYPVAPDIVFKFKYAVPLTENVGPTFKVLIVIDDCEDDIGNDPDEAVNEAIDTAPVKAPTPAVKDPICNEECDPNTPYSDEIVIEA
jgi:hypothetical protein